MNLAILGYSTTLLHLSLVYLSCITHSYSFKFYALLVSDILVSQMHKTVVVAQCLATILHKVL